MCSNDGHVSLSFAEEDLTCPICLEIFTEPLILPCGHRLCARCVALLRHNECPVDRKSFSEEVEKLPKDCFMAGIISSRRQGPRYYCTEQSCKKNVPQLSDAYFCESCKSDYLCLTCVWNKHRDPAKHNVVNVECGLNAQMERLKNCIGSENDYILKVTVERLSKEVSDLARALHLFIGHRENAESILVAMQGIAGKANQDPAHALQLLNQGLLAFDEIPQRALTEKWSRILDKIRTLERTWCLLTIRPGHSAGSKRPLDNPTESSRLKSPRSEKEPSARVGTEQPCSSSALSRPVPYSSDSE